LSFQFIGFPSEWGEDVADYPYDKPIAFPIYWVPQRVGSLGPRTWCITTRLFPIYWVPQRVGRRKEIWPRRSRTCRFQFIGFPSEWGEDIVAQSDTVHFTFPIYWVPQ